MVVADKVVTLRHWYIYPQPILSLHASHPDPQVAQVAVHAVILGARAFTSLSQGQQESFFLCHISACQSL